MIFVKPHFTNKDLEADKYRCFRKLQFYVKTPNFRQKLDITLRIEQFRVARYQVNKLLIPIYINKKINRVTFRPFVFTNEMYEM